MVPRTALDVLMDIRGKVAAGDLADYEPVPLGLAPLDKMLGGGLRPGELMLIGGAQGTGKTTMALQMARNIAASGQAYVLYVNFEHDDADMLNRLIAMESALPHLPNTKPSTGAVKITDVRNEVIRSWARAGEGEPADLAASPKLRARDRAHRPLRQQPVPPPRLGDGEHGRQPSRADRHAPPQVRRAPDAC